MSQSTLEIVILVASLLLVANLSLYLSKLIRIPFAVFLVIIGAGINLTFQSNDIISNLSLTPEVLFFIFLPVILFESAFKINYRQLRKDLSLIALLATIGVILSSLFVGSLISIIFGWPPFIALLLATVVASTDPIAVLAVFKDLGVPKRLIQLIDSESMLNDGTSVILSKVVLAIMTVGVGGYNWFGGVLDFGYVVLGSISVGMIAGFITSEIIKLINRDYFIEVSITLALAYFVFIVSEEYLHVSGIVATVVSGLVLGNYGKHNFSPQIKKTYKHIWEYIAFLANSFVFLLIGLSLDFQSSFSDWGKIFVVYIIFQVGRAIAVYPLVYIYNLHKPETQVPFGWMHVLNWGGMRGALPIAIILYIKEIAGSSLPIFDEYQTILNNYVIGVVFLSLVINGLTIKPLIKILRVDSLTIKESIERDLAKILVLGQALKKIKQLEKIGEMTRRGKKLNKKFVRELKETVSSLKITAKKNPLCHKQAIFNFTFNIENEVFNTLYAKKIINSRILHRLEIKLNQGIELINARVFPVDFKLHPLMNKISKKSKRDLNLQELYLYRKAREFANLEVLEKLEEFDNIPYLRENFVEVKKTYQQYFEKNHSVCKNLEDRFGKKIQVFEEKIFHCEFVACEERILNELDDTGTFSEITLKELHTSLLQPT